MVVQKFIYVRFYNSAKITHVTYVQGVCRIDAVGGRNKCLGDDLPSKDSSRVRRKAQSLRSKQAHVKLFDLQCLCDLLMLQLDLCVRHGVQTKRSDKGMSERRECARGVPRR